MRCLYLLFLFLSWTLVAATEETVPHTVPEDAPPEAGQRAPLIPLPVYDAEDLRAQGQGPADVDPTRQRGTNGTREPQRIVPALIPRKSRQLGRAVQH